MLLINLIANNSFFKKLLIQLLISYCNIVEIRGYLVKYFHSIYNIDILLKMSIFIPFFLLTITVMVDLLESSHFSLSFSTFVLPNLENKFTAQAIPNTLKNNINTANDSSSTTPAPDTIIVTNKPPLVKVGSNQTVGEKTLVKLDSIAVDPEGDELSYEWTQINGPFVELLNSNTTNPSFTAPEVSRDISIEFALTVTDAKGVSSDSAIINITVKHINQRPVANAGQDQKVDAGYIVSLDGTASHDPNEDNLSYSWKQISGPNITLNGNTRSIATFIAPANISTISELIFELLVIDTNNATSRDDVKITLIPISAPNNPPIANAGPDQVVEEGVNVTLDGSASSDPDGDPISYSWTQTRGPPVLLRDNDTSSPSFAAPMTNLTSNMTLGFSIQVMDNKNSDVLDIVNIVVIPKSELSSNSTDTSGQEITTTLSEELPTEGGQLVNEMGSGKTQYQFVGTWGTEGSGDGEFVDPSDIATDSAGNVYVTDYMNDRVQKFDSDGNFIAKRGDFGTGNGQFHGPNGIAVDSAGNWYVTERNNDRVQKFDSEGNFITKWGTYGKGDGQFYVPHGVATDSSGNVYVTDYNNHRVQKFDSEGNFITKWGTKGTGEGQFDHPNGVATDSAGNVYVNDDGNQRVQKFSIEVNSNKEPNDFLIINRSNDAEVTNNQNISFRNYKNNWEGIQISYPSDWKTTEAFPNPVVIFTSPTDSEFSSSSVSLNIVVDLASALDGSTNLTKFMNKHLYSQTLYHQDENYFEDFELIDSRTDSTLAGLPAYHYSYIYTDKEVGQKRYFEMVGTIKDRVEYFIYIESPLGIYENYASIINSMISSFKIV